MNNRELTAMAADFDVRDLVLYDYIFTMHKKKSERVIISYEVYKSGAYDTTIWLTHIRKAEAAVKAENKELNDINNTIKRENQFVSRVKC